jgi:ubiquinol-cytochrome c reductase cytochrome c1 subunit
MNRHAARLLQIVGLSLAVTLAGGARAASEGVTLDEWPADRGRDIASLQNGARLFVNYCLGCHSANLVRWNRLQQIGLDDKQIKDYLIPGNQKVGDTMNIAMTPAQSKAWFGKVPPDLSVITRARRSFDHLGTDYVYTLLRSYYRDNASPTGWNNVVYPNIGMPNIFWERQGPREATITAVHFNTDPKTGAVTRVRTTEVFDAEGYRQKSEAPMGVGLDDTSFAFKAADPQRAAQFDSDVADLVGFLAFITDPTHGIRVQVGVWVLVFLALFTLAAWRLNAVYWRDIK